MAAVPESRRNAERSTPPVIAITMGDPVGIGPEVVAKALCDPAMARLGRFVVYGQNQALVDAAERSGLRPLWFRVAKDNGGSQRGATAEPVVIDYGHEDVLPTEPGPSRAGGLLSKAFVEDAIADALRPASDPRRVDAVVTGPISKESWSMAGFRWPGHTELFAARCRSTHHAMLFESPRLRVALATAHLPLMDIRNVLTIGKVFDPIELGAAHCRRLGIDRPRVAVCGLNPHAGEGGTMGREEITVIRPALDLLRQEADPAIREGVCRRLLRCGRHFGPDTAAALVRLLEPVTHTDATLAAEADRFLRRCRRRQAMERVRLPLLLLATLLACLLIARA